jgi:CheY-like chemotaxis protein
VGIGTRFQVYLPAVGGIETLISENSTALIGHGELILIVDDEVAIQDITKNSLETYNYKTMIAGDGIEAIALYAKYIDKISVVLMDMMLPSLDGLTAIRTLKKINPNIKIIATSGLMSNNKLMAVAEAGVTTFLSKPYTINELLLALQKVLTN